MNGSGSERRRPRGAAFRSERNGSRRGPCRQGGALRGPARRAAFQQRLRGGHGRPGERGSPYARPPPRHQDRQAGGSPGPIQEALGDHRGSGRLTIDCGQARKLDGNRRGSVLIFFCSEGSNGQTDQQRLPQPMGWTTTPPVHASALRSGRRSSAPAREAAPPSSRPRSLR